MRTSSRSSPGVRMEADASGDEEAHAGGGRRRRRRRKGYV